MRITIFNATNLLALSECIPIFMFLFSHLSAVCIQTISKHANYFFFQTETVKKCFLFGVLPLQSKLNKEPPFIYEWIRYLNEKCKFFVCIFFFCRAQQTHDIFWWWSKDMIQCICTLQNARLLYLHVGMCLSARLVCGMW